MDKKIQKESLKAWEKMPPFGMSKWEIIQMIFITKLLNQK